MDGGGDHINGGGGYSAGLGENTSIGTICINGRIHDRPAQETYWGTGGSYFTPHMYDQKVERPWLGGLIGGQGATCLDERDVRCYDSSGDGGKAGNGGNINVSQVCEINAFNGNECTLNKSDSAYYYKPVDIYIQNGHLLEVRKFNTWWGIKKNVNYQFFCDILGDTLEVNVKDVIIGDSIEKIKNILIRSEKDDDSLKLSYRDNGNILYVGQGIGSGAGYIEVSNGTYTVDPSMN